MPKRVLKYSDGTTIKLGDRVQIGASWGTVVVHIDDGCSLATHPIEDWRYLNHGVMIDFEEYGLIHYVETEDDEDLQFKLRGQE